MAAIEELAAEVDRAEIIASVEQAAGIAASRSSGRSLSARLDAEKGNLVCYVVKRVATEVQDPEAEVAADRAPEGASPGDLVEIPVPFGTAARSAARAAGAVLEARLGAARMLSRAERYRDRIGKLETAIVARREGQDLIVNLGPVEGRLPAEEQSRHEVFNPEDPIRAAVHSIEPHDPPVILSRIAPAVLAGLIERETPEVRRGVVQVRAVARHPGLRAKVAVSSAVAGVDPVAACLGPGGSRIRAVSRELRGERVDVVLWDDKMEKFARNALRPAEVLDIRTVDEQFQGGGSRRLREKGGLLVTVAETELPRTLGKRGQNVRLASQLLGVDIEVAAEGDSLEADERRARRDPPDTGSPRRGPRDTERRGRDTERRGPRDTEWRGSRDTERRGRRDTERRGPRDTERRGPRDAERRVPAILSGAVPAIRIGAVPAIRSGAVPAIWSGAVPAIRSPRYGVGAVPAIRSGAVPAIRSGAVPAIWSGAVPAIRSGAVPAIWSGAVPAMRNGAVPAIRSGAVPAMRNGAVPAIRNGAVPAIRSGAVPAIWSGVVPAMRNGAVPAIRIGAVPAIRIGAVPAIRIGAVPAIRIGAVPAIRIPAISARSPRYGSARSPRYGSDRRGPRDTDRYGPRDTDRRGPRDTGSPRRGPDKRRGGPGGPSRHHGPRDHQPRPRRADRPDRVRESAPESREHEQPVVEPTRPSSPGGGSAGDPSRLNCVASRRSSLRFGRNTLGPVLPVGAPPSRALSAGRLTGLGAHAGSTTGC